MTFRVESDRGTYIHVRLPQRSYRQVSAKSLNLMAEMNKHYQRPESGHYRTESELDSGTRACHPEPARDLGDNSVSALDEDALRRSG